MFYATDKNDHGLPHDPFKAIIAPRPIGWITSMSANGAINLAPYSYFNGVSDSPPMVMFASEGRKDLLAFVEETKEFVCNLATWDLREQMNQTSAPYPRGINEMAEAGLDTGAVPPGQAAARRRGALRARMQVPADRRPATISTASRSIACRVRPRGRRAHRRALHPQRPARHRRHEADRARRLSGLLGGRQGDPGGAAADAANAKTKVQAAE